MEEIGDVIGCVDPPGWRKFYREDEHTGVTVRGEADAIFQLTGGSYLIADYKTSRYNPERLYALRSYEIQLNAYAWSLPARSNMLRHQIPLLMAGYNSVSMHELCL